MTEKYKLTQYKEARSSKAREIFDALPGKYSMRSINLSKVDEGQITNLEQRPSYCPEITLFQIKKTESNHAFVFSEVIPTTNGYIAGFENYVRAHLVSVEAEDFEEVPEGALHLFETPYTLIPTDVTRHQLKLGSQVIQEIDQIKGVDFSSHCTLKMIQSEVLYDKLNETERTGNYKITIEEDTNFGVNESSNKMIVFESRKGNEHVTVNHLLYTLQDKRFNFEL
tara:strand:- start:5049 stop:5723 length:675 start_codon:yes stop_codon:yes gene_type:complete